MFRSIGNTLDRKKKSSTGTGEKNSDTKLIFSKFLDEYFTEYKNLFKWEVSYNPKDGKVIIDTGSKLIAGELSLRIKELSKLFKEANLRVTQIIIV